jgi:hypothetical protein
MPNTSNNYNAFYGGTGTTSNNASAFADTVSSGTTLATWNTIEDYDWSAQTTSAVLTGAGSAVMGGKTVTNVLVGSTPTYTSQVVNGQGLVFTVTALAGAGGAAFRFDLATASFNPGEEILLELLVSTASFGAVGTQLFMGQGSSGHYSQGDWHGAQITSLAGNVTTNHAVRGYATTGGARTVNVATGVAVSTDYLVQVWFDGSYASRIGIADAQTTLLPQPVIGAATPFDANLDVGLNGTSAAITPAISLNGVFSSALRCIIGVGVQNGNLTLKRHRLSRVTRMV